VASNLLTSETLIHMADEEMFEAKFQWLLARARVTIKHLDLFATN
jgi:hypothetical protein